MPTFNDPAKIPRFLEAIDSGVDVVWLLAHFPEFP
jgi:hypothetical protein